MEKKDDRIYHLEKMIIRLWQCLCLEGIAIILLTLTSHKENILALILQKLGLQ